MHIPSKDSYFNPLIYNIPVLSTNSIKQKYTSPILKKDTLEICFAYYIFLLCMPKKILWI